ncbi:hypothetical protein E9993_07605 [Labilibacter sediminis]|nr:hypothetical protein E9993_07605 [Labilibacter sediminis]
MDRLICMKWIFIFLLLATSCELFENEEECKKTETTEINFGLLVGGQVKVISNNTGNDVTAMFEDVALTVFFNKIYCDGTNKGPFEEYFVLDKYGVMFRNGIGNWEFRMDNHDDYMRLSFFLDGNAVGKYNLPYSMLKPYDKRKAYFEFDILCEYTESNVDNDVYGVQVTLR